MQPLISFCLIVARWWSQTWAPLDYCCLADWWTDTSVSTATLRHLGCLKGTGNRLICAMQVGAGGSPKSYFPISWHKTCTSLVLWAVVSLAYNLQRHVWWCVVDSQRKGRSWGSVEGQPMLGPQHCQTSGNFWTVKAKCRWIPQRYYPFNNASTAAGSLSLLGHCPRIAGSKSLKLVWRFIRCLSRLCWTIQAVKAGDTFSGIWLQCNNSDLTNCASLKKEPERFCLSHQLINTDVIPKLTCC